MARAVPVRARHELAQPAGAGDPTDQLGLGHRPHPRVGARHGGVPERLRTRPICTCGRSRASTRAARPPTTTGSARPPGSSSPRATSAIWTRPGAGGERADEILERGDRSRRRTLTAAVASRRSGITCSCFQFFLLAADRRAQDRRRLLRRRTGRASSGCSSSSER